MSSPVSSSTTILLPWDVPPLSLNDRHSSKFEEAKIIAKTRADAGWVVKSRRLGRHPHVTVELRYQPKRRGRHDEDNLVATQKPICDGIVDVGVVPDDTPEYMTKLMPVVITPTRSQRRGMLWLIITPSTPRGPVAAPDTWV